MSCSGYSMNLSLNFIMFNPCMYLRVASVCASIGMWKQLVCCSTSRVLIDELGIPSFRCCFNKWFYLKSCAIYWFDIQKTFYVRSHQILNLEISCCLSPDQSPTVAPLFTLFTSIHGPTQPFLDIVNQSNSCSSHCCASLSQTAPLHHSLSSAH